MRACGGRSSFNWFDLLMSLPLEGLTVVAIEQAVAAPYCTVRLADAGARVLKVERPEGDFARGYDDTVLGQSSYFVWLNRGKESVVLDFRDPDCLAQLHEMVDNADVVVQNMRPGVLQRLGFGPSDMRERNPGLIVCSITGFGDEGPMAGRKAYDLLVQAEAGLCSITGGPEASARVGISVVDIATGATAHAAILEALISRGKTGVGAEISISMFDVIAEWMAVPLLQAEGGRPPSRIGLRHPSVAPYGVFETRDGRQLLLAVQHDREWGQLCEHLLLDVDLATDPKFSTNVERVNNRPLTDALVERVINQLDMDEVCAKLQDAQIGFACANDMDGLSKHPHLRRVKIDTPAGSVDIPAPPVRIRGEERAYGPVPALGGPTNT